MKPLILAVSRIVKTILLLLIAPFPIAIASASLALADLVPKRKRTVADRLPNRDAASILIPNWNGRDLLEKYLPSVVAAIEGHPGSEIIVVDNGSSDGSADFLRQAFPSVRLLALPSNLGFGGGSNAGFAAAHNDIVVLLNSDMRVDPGFLQPLLTTFADEKVFAASCQIFFSDPAKLREETGLTQGWWADGGLRVGHRIDPEITEGYPCFYGGGGSCAFDRHKFQELGGFDSLLAPFYLEDTDLGYMAWKRGWKVLYQPQSVVFHEHRGTIGKKFTQQYIDGVLRKNFILFAWKNIADWRMLASHFFYQYANLLITPDLGGLWRAFLQLPQAIRSRRRARSLAVIPDCEAFRRPLGGYFRDRFASMPASPEPLRVLFLSPYPIWPPTHGGAVFMSQTVSHLVRQTELHLIVLLDYDWQLPQHQEHDGVAASVQYIVRLESKQRQIASYAPHAVVEFSNPDLHWLIHRQIFLHQIDVVQIEYTALAQYALEFQRLGCMLFEHDVYFQSIARQLPQMQGVITKVQAAFEYLRALRYELNILPHFDRIQVCSPANADTLTSFRPDLKMRIDSDLRAGIDTSLYEFQPDGREPFTMLFLGSFRHTPNQVALNWFIATVLPSILKKVPQARLVVVGSDPPPRHSLPDLGNALELRGFVEDAREPLGRYAVFVCPILAGSGMRVKLLEAFAAGMPVVSTRLGAEGLATNDGEFAGLSDDPAGFATRIIDLFENSNAAREMAIRAHRYVVETRDMATMTDRLVGVYRSVIGRKRPPKIG